MYKLKKIFFNAGSTTAYGIISAIFMLVPEDVFKLGLIQCEWHDSAIIIANRIFFSAVILVTANFIYNYCYKNKTSVTIADKNNIIRIEYGDLTKIESGLKVINFDECFTTTVGTRPQDVKPDSVCGQYLTLYPIEDMNSIIQAAGIQSVGVSRYNNQLKYESGTLIKKDDYFLMAFAKLDEKGRGTMNYGQYLECLDKLWQELDLYHGTDDVYVPVLGSRITRFEKELTQQELIDVMISSYRLSPYKMKRPNILHIVCRRRDGFSLNNIIGIE